MACTITFNGVDQYLQTPSFTPSGVNFDVGITYTPEIGDIGVEKTLIAGLLTKNASDQLVVTYTDINAIVNTLTLTTVTLAADTEYDIVITSDGNGVTVAVDNIVVVQAGDYLSGNGADVRGELNIPVTASSTLELVLIPNANGVAQDLLAGDVSGTLLGINAGNQIVFNGLSSVTVNNSAIASSSFVVESDKSYTINALFSASENITSIHSSAVPNNFSSSILTAINIDSGEYVYKLNDIRDLGGMGLLLQTGIQDQYLNELWVKALGSFSSVSSRVNVTDEGSGVYTLSSTGATGEHFLRDSFNFGISGSVVSRVQAEFKMISHRYAGLRIAGPMYAIFDLQEGTVQSFFTTPAVIEDIGDGWYRCTLTAYTAPAFPSILMSDSSNPYNPTIPLGDSFLVRNYSYRVSTNAVVNNYDPLTDLSTIENIPAQVTDTDVIDPSALSIDTWLADSGGTGGHANGIPSDLSLTDKTLLQGGEFLLGNGTDTEVDIPPITLSGDFDLEFEIMFSVPPPSNKVIWGGNNNIDYYINISNGSTITFWSSGGFDAFSLAFEQNIPVKVKFELRGTSLTLRADGKLVQTRAVNPYRSSFASKLFRSINVGAYFPGYLIFKLTKLDTGETYEYLTKDSVIDNENGTATATNTGNTGPAFDATVQNFAPTDLVTLPNNSHAWPLITKGETQPNTVSPSDTATIVNYTEDMVVCPITGTVLDKDAGKIFKRTKISGFLSPTKQLFKPTGAY